MLVLFPFLLALMSKPMVVTLPVIMILLDYWPLKRFESNKDNLFLWQLKEKIPFVILSAVLVISTLLAQHSSMGKGFPLKSRLANASVSFVAYLEKTFWPHNLAIFYPFPQDIPLWHAFVATLLIIAVSAVFIFMAKRLPYLFVGWLWYTITILPVIGIIQSGDQAMADRFHYLPSIGIAVMLAWGIPYLINSISIRKNILFPVVIAFLAIMSVLTWKQCEYWKNSTTLFSHALLVTKDNDVVHNNLGLVLIAEGKTEEAIVHFNEAIRINPDYAYAYYCRGTIYHKLGQYQLAVEDLSKVISSYPDNPLFYFSRGNSYINLGYYQLAIEDFNKAISLKPDYADAYNNRGFIHLKLGRHQQAFDDYSYVIQLQPIYANAWNNRAFVYLYIRGNIDLGCKEAQIACEQGVCDTLEKAKGQGYCR